MFNVILFKFFENGEFKSFSFPTFHSVVSFESISEFITDRFKDCTEEELNSISSAEVWSAGIIYEPDNENKPFSLTPSFKIGNFIDLYNYKGDFDNV